MKIADTLSEGDVLYRWKCSVRHHHPLICQTTDPKPLPKRFLHIVRSRASSFNWQYPLLSLRSSSSFLRLLPRLLVTSIYPFIFPSITCCRRQFLRKMWPIQLSFRFLISCRIFLCYRFNRLTPNDPYMGRAAPLTSKRCILYIYSTNTGTEYFKHALYSPFFLFKMQFVS